MDDLPLGWLISAVLVLIMLSAFFSGSETAMMALNRYRLRHLAESGHAGARRAARLLERPDRLIGLILLGNNAVNILASALATVIGLRVFGEVGIAIAAGVLTFVVLIFAEVAPKTLAAIHPERIAFPAAHVLAALLWLLFPFVWVINGIANRLLAATGARPGERAKDSLSSEELRTAVKEASSMIPHRHQKMLINILDLEKVTVNDIMVPRNEIAGIDLNAPIDEIVEQLSTSQHTRLPVYRDDINNVIGLLHLRKAIRLFDPNNRITAAQIEELSRDAYFVPEGTGLHNQLMQFQRKKRRIGLVVDEYGDIQGLVTLEDILEEIVGEFTTDPDAQSPDVHPQEDGTFLVDGSATIRELNRSMGWDLPADGPKTLNGVILEYLESIPEPGTSLLLAGYPVEIVQTTGNAVRMVRISPARRQAGGDTGEQAATGS